MISAKSLAEIQRRGRNMLDAWRLAIRRNMIRGHCNKLIVRFHLHIISARHVLDGRRMALPVAGFESMVGRSKLRYAIRLQP